MNAAIYAITLFRARRDLVSLEDAARHFGLHPELVRRFLDFGLIEAAEVNGSEIMLNSIALHRIGVIQHLRSDLGVNLAGIGVILELLDRMDVLMRGGRNGHQ